MSQIINQTSRLFRVVPQISRSIVTVSHGRQIHPQQQTVNIFSHSYMYNILLTFFY